MSTLEISRAPEFDQEAISAEIAAEVAELEKTPAMHDAEENAKLAADEFGVEPKELRMVDMVAEKKAEQKATAAEVVVGQQKLVNGKVIDPDGRSVLDKMRAAGNVSAEGLGKQMRLEADLLLKGVHVSDKFEWQGRTLITITRLDAKGALNFTNYEIDPDATLFGASGPDFSSFGSLSMAPKQIFTDSLAASAESRGVTSEPLTATMFESFEFNQGNSVRNTFESQADMVRERGKNEVAERSEVFTDEVSPVSPDGPRSFSPETATLSESSKIVHDFIPADLKEKIVDQITDREAGIRMIRYQAVHTPSLNF